MRLSLSEEVLPLPSPGMNAMVNMTFRDAANEKTSIPSSALFKKKVVVAYGFMMRRKGALSGGWFR